MCVLMISDTHDEENLENEGKNADFCEDAH